MLLTLNGPATQIKRHNMVDRILFLFRLDGPQSPLIEFVADPASHPILLPGDEVSVSGTIRDFLNIATSDDSLALNAAMMKAEKLRNINRRTEWTAFSPGECPL